jgi:biopolymer transport protein ExbB/TolQ
VIRYVRFISEDEVAMFESIIEFFQSGGVFMYPIVVVLALGVAIAVERWIYLTGVRISNQRLWKEVMPLLNTGRMKEAKQKLDGSRSAIARILGFGLARMHGPGRRRDDVEMAMEEGLMEVIPRLEKRTHYLATLANLATLLGLLGTIMGLIEAFTAVAAANPQEKADMLSASISVAMNTTAFGLMVGIPLLFVHTVLQTKSTEVVDSLEMASVRFVNMLTEKRPEGAAA